MMRTSHGLPADLPTIIQGGMGIGVSGWCLARAVSRQGGLGVVSGTAIDTVMIRRLQLGDAEGHVRRALEHFPHRPTAQRILDGYFIPGGLPEDAPFKLLPMPSQRMNQFRAQVIVAANFVEVFLAKEGHQKPVGINYLEKIQLPTLPSLYGAMLAGVDVVLMGAGIPTAIPGILDRLATGRSVELRLQVDLRMRTESGRPAEVFTSQFDPREVFGRELLDEQGRGDGSARPLFLPIISSHILAKTLARKSSGRVDGFVVETHVAGGHNAPPRKSRSPQETGDAWGPQDEPNLDVLRQQGLPFWLAGGRATPEGLSEALEQGARGIQVGTAFAYCEESGIPREIKRKTIERCRRGALSVVTDFEASPTGYPFKLVKNSEDPGEFDRLRNRKRVCDLGYLRQNYADAQGRLGYRCSGEPQETYVKKGGALEETHNKMCLCNGLLATVGLGQRRQEAVEPPIYTAGGRIEEIVAFVRPGADSYTAEDVLERLRGGAVSSRTATE